MNSVKRFSQKYTDLTYSRKILCSTTMLYLHVTRYVDIPLSAKKIRSHRE